MQRLWDDIEADPSTEVTVDVVERQVRWSGEVHDFDLDDYTRWRLMEGLDDIGLTAAAHRCGRRVRSDAQAVAAATVDESETPWKSTKKSRDTRRDCVVVACERPSVSGETTTEPIVHDIRPGGHVPNKAQFVELLAERLDGDKKKAQAALDAVIDTVYHAVSKGERVALTGFGVFEKRERAARTARNPATGATVKVKKTSVPAFRAGAEFKAITSGAKKLAKAPAKRARRGREEGRRQGRRRREGRRRKKAPAKKAAGEEGAGQEGRRRRRLPPRRPRPRRRPPRRLRRRSPASYDAREEGRTRAGTVVVSGRVALRVASAPGRVVVVGRRPRRRRRRSAPTTRPCGCRDDRTPGPESVDQGRDASALAAHHASPCPAWPAPAARLRSPPGRRSYASSENAGSTAPAGRARAASGSTVWMQRVRSAEKMRVGANSAAASPAVGLALAAGSSGRRRSSPRHSLRLPAFACRTRTSTESGTGMAAKSRSTCGRRRSSAAGTRRPTAQPCDLVDLVVRLELAAAVAHRPVRDPSSASPTRYLTVPMRRWTATAAPSSSPTSRTAATSRARRGRACPSAASSRRSAAGGRAATSGAPSRMRHTTPPAAVIALARGAAQRHSPRSASRRMSSSW